MRTLQFQPFFSFMHIHRSSDIISEEAGLWTKNLLVIASLLVDTRKVSKDIS